MVAARAPPALQSTRTTEFSFSNLSWSSAVDPYGHEPNAPEKSIKDQTTEVGQQSVIGRRKPRPLPSTVKEHPLATLVVVGGLAFAIGASLKLQRGLGI